MKKWILSICVLTLISLLVVTPALGWEVTRIKTKTLPIAGDVTFTSGFKAADGETIQINILSITPDNPSIVISDVQLVKITPKPRQHDGSIVIGTVGSRYINVTLDNPRPGKSTFHLWLYLSTGEHVGVNIQFGR